MRQCGLDSIWVALLVWLGAGLPHTACWALSGTGSSQDPYLIQTEADFNVFIDSNQATVYWAAGVYARLTTDIDLAGRSFTQALIAPDTDPANGYHGKGYKGNFDGNGNSISNLTIDIVNNEATDDDQNDYLGLFGRIDSTGVVHDLALKAINLVGGAGSVYAGGIAGYNDKGQIQQCCVTDGSVNGSASVGGVCGFNDGTIKNSYSAAAVSAAGNYLGGLCGTNYYVGQIEKCYAAGAVSGLAAYKGGLCGYTRNTQFIACYWDKDTAGVSKGIGYSTSAIVVPGLTGDEMKDINLFINAGWSFFDNDGAPTIWRAGDKWLVLSWQMDLEELYYEGNLAVEVNEGDACQAELILTNRTDDAITWNISNYKNCPWLVAINPLNGVISGGETLTISITLDSGTLAAGIYQRDLNLNYYQKVITLPLKMTVLHHIGLENYLLLSENWGATGCRSDQPCAAADWYRDGRVNLKDLLVLAASWLEPAIEIITPQQYYDGFESNSLSGGLDWELSGDGSGWFTTSTVACQGSYAAQSGPIGHAKKTVLELTLYLAETTINQVSFYYKVSTELNCDKLIFSIDQVEKGSWSGWTNNWTEQRYSFTPGTHTFTWTYAKDSDWKDHDDTVWIDEVRFYHAGE